MRISNLPTQQVSKKWSIFFVYETLFYFKWVFTSFLEIYIYIYIIGLGGVGNLHEILKFMKYIIKKKKCAKENNHTR